MSVMEFEVLNSVILNKPKNLNLERLRNEVKRIPALYIPFKIHKL